MSSKPGLVISCCTGSIVLHHGGAAWIKSSCFGLPFLLSNSCLPPKAFFWYVKTLGPVSRQLLKRTGIADSAEAGQAQKRQIFRRT